MPRVQPQHKTPLIDGRWDQRERCAAHRDGSRHHTATAVSSTRHSVAGAHRHRQGPAGRVLSASPRGARFLGSHELQALAGHNSIHYHVALCPP